MRLFNLCKGSAGALPQTCRGLCPLDPHLRPFCKRVLRIPKTFKIKMDGAIRDPMPEEGPPWGPDPIRVGERQGSALDPPRTFCKRFLELQKPLKQKYESQI